MVNRAGSNRSSQLRRAARSAVLRAAAAGALGLAAGGCERRPPALPPPAASQPALELAADAQPTSAAAPLDPILSASHQWTVAEALERLADDAAAPSAALRLVRLAGLKIRELPEPLPADVAARLRVHVLPNALRIVGIADADDAQRVHTPLIIDADGGVRPPGDGAAWTLHLADDPDIFPHLLIGPQRVLNAAELHEAALLLASPADLAFDLRRTDGYPYVALLLPGEGAAIEVGRFAWEPYERAFVGPAVDRLPTPPGGVFRMDLRESAALQPVGGLIEEPDPLNKPPPERPQRPEDDDLPPPY